MIKITCSFLIVVLLTFTVITLSYAQANPKQLPNLNKPGACIFKSQLKDLDTATTSVTLPANKICPDSDEHLRGTDKDGNGVPDGQPFIPRRNKDFINDHSNDNNYGNDNDDYGNDNESNRFGS